LADGVKIYDTGVLFGWSATQSVNVSVSDKDELAVIINDAANGGGRNSNDRNSSIDAAIVNLPNAACTQ